MDTSYLLSIAVSLLFSAFFSGMEIAFFSANKVRLELDNQKGGAVAKILKYFYDHNERFISTMLVGNNIALIVYGIFMAELLEPFIRTYILSNDVFVVLTQTLLSTVIILFTAEYMPKTLFKLNPNLMLRTFAIPLVIIYFLLYPISSFAILLSHGILHIFGMKIEKNKHTFLTKVDLNFFIQQGIDQTPNDQEAEQELIMFQNALDFSNVKVRDCMIPRSELTTVSFDTTFAQLNKLFVETGYSKIPVFKEDIDNLIGYIHSSEMFKKPKDWTDKIIPIPIVPETMSAQKLLRMLMEQKKSIAAVVDEFGGTAGVITMEDLFEEIIGDIEDEHDHHTLIAHQTGDHEYVFSARMEISKINENFNLDLPESEEYVTLAGLILHETQSVPHIGDTVELDNGRINITIIKATSAKIETVKLVISK